MAPARLRTARGFTLRLPFRPPLDWTGLLAFLAPRAIPGVEAVVEGTWRRITRDGDLIEATRADCEPFVQLRVEGSARADTDDLVARARRLLDLGADPQAIASHLRRDPLLSRRLAARPGVRVPGAWDPFELAVRAVLGQQVSVRAASTLAGRLVQAFGRPLSAPRAGLTHRFPTARALARADARRIGLPRARAATLCRLAAAVRDRHLVLDGSAALSETMARLLSIPGIGEWTAQYVAMRALGEPDALPAGDLGLRKALATGGAPASPKTVLARAQAWRPFRAYAAILLWEVRG